MEMPDEKRTAILALLIIALGTLFIYDVKGLDVVTNIVCALGGLVTGAGLSK